MPFFNYGRKLRCSLSVPLFFACLLSWLGGAGWASEAGQWLDRASDPKLSLREREYAARRLIVLADTSASTLISELGDPRSDALRRQVAAATLGEIGRPEAEAALLDAAFGDDYFLAETAALALGRLYSRLGDPELFTLLRQGGRDKNRVPGGIVEGDDWRVLAQSQERNRSRFRSFVMRGLARKYAAARQPIPDPLLGQIWNGLADPDRELRLYSIRAAALSGSNQAPGKIAALLYMETDAALLIEGLRAMAAMRPPEHGETVERHVGHADPMVALEALAALDAMGYEGAMFPSPVLHGAARSVAGFVNHPSTPVRRRAIALLGGSKNPAAIGPLHTALRDRIGANRAAAVRALGELGFAGASGSLSLALLDLAPEVREEAVVVLARLGVVGASARARDDLAGSDQPLRLAAASALGRIGDRQAVPALSRALGDADLELACRAAEALGRIGDKAAGRALYMTMTGAANPVLAEAARKALAAIFLDDPGENGDEWRKWAERNPVSG